MSKHHFLICAFVSLVLPILGVTAEEKVAAAPAANAEQEQLQKMDAQLKKLCEERDDELIKARRKRKDKARLLRKDARAESVRAKEDAEGHEAKARAADQKQKILLKDKWLYFNGKMDQAEIAARGWPYDPFNGLKIMKSDLEYYFNADPELQKSEEKIIYIKTLVETLEEIMGTLRWRHTHIKNMIDWRKFTSGA